MPTLHTSSLYRSFSIGVEGDGIKEQCEKNAGLDKENNDQGKGWRMHGRGAEERNIRIEERIKKSKDELIRQEWRKERRSEITK